MIDEKTENTDAEQAERDIFEEDTVDLPMIPPQQA